MFRHAKCKHIKGNILYITSHYCFCQPLVTPYIYTHILDTEIVCFTVASAMKILDSLISFSIINVVTTMHIYVYIFQ